jgi:hypothetical protein
MPQLPLNGLFTEFRTQCRPTITLSFGRLPGIRESKEMRPPTSWRTSVPPSSHLILVLYLNPLLVGSAPSSGIYANKYKTLGRLLPPQDFLLGIRNGTLIIKSGPYRNSSSPEPYFTACLQSGRPTATFHGITAGFTLKQKLISSAPAVFVRNPNIWSAAANQLYRIDSQNGLNNRYLYYWTESIASNISLALWQNQMTSQNSFKSRSSTPISAPAKGPVPFIPTLGQYGTVPEDSSLRLEGLGFRFWGCLVICDTGLI